MTTALAPPDLSTLAGDKLDTGNDSGPMLKVGDVTFEGVQVKDRHADRCTFLGSPPHPMVVTPGDLVYGRTSEGSEYLSEWEMPPLHLDPLASPANPTIGRALQVTFVEATHRLPDMNL